MAAPCAVPTPRATPTCVGTALPCALAAAKGRGTCTTRHVSAGATPRVATVGHTCVGHASVCAMCGHGHALRSPSEAQALHHGRHGGARRAPRAATARRQGAHMRPRTLRHCTSSAARCADATGHPHAHRPHPATRTGSGEGTWPAHASTRERARHSAHGDVHAQGRMPRVCATCAPMGTPTPAIRGTCHAT